MKKCDCNETSCKTCSKNKKIIANRCKMLDEMKTEKFGKIEVIDIIDYYADKIKLFCKCDCGNFLSANVWDLKSEKQKTCGCSKFDNLKISEQIGLKYGMLTVKEFIGIVKKCSVYLFECECGNIIESRYKTVKDGDRKSCGCHRKKKEKKVVSRKTDREPYKKNVDLSGAVFEFGEVLDKLKSGYWRVRCNCGNIFHCQQGRLLGNSKIKSTPSCYDCTNTRKIKQTKDRVIGEKWGRLEIVGYEESEKSIYDSRIFCHCECGNFISTGYHVLITGNTSSCGCLRSEMLRASNFIGVKFGILTPIEFIGKTKRGDLKYLCECDCGNTRISTSRLIKTGDIKSCGCLNNESMILAGKNRRAKNSAKRIEKQRKENLMGYDERRKWKDKSELRTLSFYCYKRDNFTCNKCNCKTDKTNKPNAHHMNGHNWDFHNRKNLSNLLLLCNGCHSNFHRIYGSGGNTIEQIMEFLGHVPKHLENEPIQLDLLIKKFDPIYLGI